MHKCTLCRAFIDVNIAQKIERNAKSQIYMFCLIEIIQVQCATQHICKKKWKRMTAIETYFFVFYINRNIFAYNLYAYSIMQHPINVPLYKCNLKSLPQ